MTDANSYVEVLRVSFFDKAVFRWTFLSRLGTSKFLKETSKWFVLVPLVVRALTFLKSQAIGELNPELYSWVTVPHDWQLLYYAAFAILLATIIFQLTAPQIFKDYIDFFSFSRSVAESKEALDYFMEAIHLDGRENESYVSVKALLALADDPRSTLKIVSPEISIEEVDATLYSASFSDSYRRALRSMWSHCNLANRKARIVCFSLYLVGFIFLGLTFLSDLIDVIEQSINSNLLGHLISAANIATIAIF